MSLLKKNKGNNRLLKLYKSLSQTEAEAYDTKNFIEFLLIDFEKLNLSLNSFYITGPYPNNGWKTKKGFLKGLNKRNYKNIHHLMISDSEKRMFLDFQNWSHNRTVEVESDSIVFELMVDENLMTNEELVSLGKRLYQVFNFEYGYIFTQSKKFSISEGKIKKGLFSYSVSQNPSYEKWSKYESATKFGFIRTVYELNFLSLKHLEKEEINEVVKNTGKLDHQVGFSVWTLTANEVEKTLDKLRTCSVVVENDQFNKTETCRLIDNEIKKYSRQQGE